MADLKVTYAVYDTAHAALGRIAQELEDSKARRDALEHCWGGREVQRAMRGFVDDWDRHRRQLAEALRAMSDQSRVMAETFMAIDAALALAAAGEEPT